MKLIAKRWFVALLILAAVFVPACGPGYPGMGAGGGAAGPDRAEGGIRFSLYHPKAKKAAIAGDFNGWSPLADPMFDRAGTGLWTIVLPLQPGRYEYKYVVDGEKWIPDPGNPEREKDGFGGHNSVVVVGP
jgi:1,4-alpha-glucan branching enzyme